MTEYMLGLARSDEVRHLPGIECRAAALFSPEDLSPELARVTTPIPVFAEAQKEDRLLVVRDATEKVVGFAHLIWVGDDVHLEEIDVDPAFGRRGIGRSLVEAACAWARERGSDRITLSTFRDVAWNAPFYARLDFVEIPEAELTTPLRLLREHEAKDGLDIAKRIMMCRVLRPRADP